MKVARWKYHSLAEGPRPNTTFWLSGCRIHCKGCFNPELWDGMLGKELSIIRLLAILKEGRYEGDRGAAFVGGEPMDQAEALGRLCLAARLLYPGHILTVYSGYTVEALRRRRYAMLVLLTAHYLVDGPFVLSLANPNLGYRGSRNQRIIDLAATRKSGWREAALANWDGLIAYGPGELSGPPTIMERLGSDDENQCGKF